MPTDRPIIAVTTGDAAGIGPEIVLKAVCDRQVTDVCQPVVVGHPALLLRAMEVGPTVGDFEPVDLTDSVTSRQLLEASIRALKSGQVPMINPCDEAVLNVPAGVVDAAAGQAAYQCLTTAIGLAQHQIADGIATAPLNKEALHQAGHSYPGHTEILAHSCCVDDFAMMLHLPESRLTPIRALVNSEAGNCEVGDCGLSIAHVTLHTSVASVSELLSVEGITATAMLMDDFLARLGSTRRSIAVAALNPHGGEHGLFGGEEADVIEPAIVAARARGCRVTGPLPADTLVRRAVAGEFDGVVAMYHDQGHIPVKLLGFDSAINITLGLPIVRTSPTHGTAFDRAWNPDTPADPSGMIESILTAARLCRRQARGELSRSAE